MNFKIGLPELALVLVWFLAVALWTQIFHKAGYSRWLGLLTFVPVVNVFAIIWFALAKWPLLVEVEALRNELRSRADGTKP